MGINSSNFKNHLLVFIYNNDNVRHLTLIHPPRYQILVDTFTMNANDFFLPRVHAFFFLLVLGFDLASVGYILCTLYIFATVSIPFPKKKKKKNNSIYRILLIKGCMFSSRISTDKKRTLLNQKKK